MQGACVAGIRIGKLARLACAAIASGRAPVVPLHVAGHVRDDYEETVPARKFLGDLRSRGHSHPKYGILLHEPPTTRLGHAEASCTQVLVSEERGANERCGLVNAVDSDHIELGLTGFEPAPQVCNKPLAGAAAHSPATRLLSSHRAFWLHRRVEAKTSVTPVRILSGICLVRLS